MEKQARIRAALERRLSNPLGEEREAKANSQWFEETQSETLLKTDRTKFALVRQQQIIAFFSTARNAWECGLLTFEDGIFSIHEIESHSDTTSTTI